MQTKELYVAKFLSLTYSKFHILHCNTELILCQSCCDICMGMRSHIRIYAETYSCHLILGSCKLVDDTKFFERLYIETENARIETKVYLPICLTYTSINYLASIETSLKSLLYLSTTHGIHAQSCLLDYLQYLNIGISLYSVVKVIAIVLGHFSLNSCYRIIEHTFVIIIERCLKRFETFDIQCSNLFLVKQLG